MSMTDGSDVIYIQKEGIGSDYIAATSACFPNIRSISPLSQK